jgi:hypothetical protein
VPSCSRVGEGAVGTHWTKVKAAPAHAGCCSGLQQQVALLLLLLLLLLLHSGHIEAV